MRQIRTVARRLEQRSAALAAIGAVAAATGGCGAPASAPATGILSITVNDPNVEHVDMHVPPTATSGVVRIQLHNRGSTAHDAQLLRAEGPHGLADVAQALEADIGERQPPWLTPAGGVAAVAPGGTAEATVRLVPGTYYVADTLERHGLGGGVKNAHKGGLARLDVIGADHSARLPRTPGRITATDGGFTTRGIGAGPNLVTFHNGGREMHQVVAIRAPARPTRGRRFPPSLVGPTRWLSVDAPASRATAVLDSGMSEVLKMVLRSGRYVLVCYVRDRGGGATHLDQGMAGTLLVR